MHTIQYYCIGEQNSTIGLPINKRLLGTNKLKRDERWSQNGHLILIEHQQFMSLWVKVGVACIYVIFMDRMEGRESQQDYFLGLPTDQVMFFIKLEDVIHIYELYIRNKPTWLSYLISIEQDKVRKMIFLTDKYIQQFLVNNQPQSESFKMLVQIVKKIYICYNKNRRMQAKPSKPYFIELYNASDLLLKNKFKFVLDAQKVGELRQQVKSKLIGKKQLENDSQIIIKDNDEFELASDDQVKDVIPDCKVKVYIKSKPVVVSPVVINPLPVVPQIVSSIQDKEIICKSSLLDLTNFKIPVVGPQTKHKLLVRCPQIPKTGLLEIPITENIKSFYDLSKEIVVQLGLSNGLKALLYNRKGQPIFYNIDLMHFPLPKLDYSQEMWVVFTATNSTIDTAVQSSQKIVNSTSISILRGTDKYQVEVDLDNTVQFLKVKIFQTIKYHPLNQILKFGGKLITNSADSLKMYGIAEGSIIQVSFKLSSNLVPCTFADKFYYKDIQHVKEQSEQGIAELRSTLLTLAAHLSADDKIKLVAFIRALTNNLPLAYNLKCLFANNFVSQLHRIAIEQGLLLAVSDYLHSCNPLPDQLVWKECFTKLREFIGFVLQGALKIALTEQIRAQSKCVQIQRNCHFTLGPIKEARFVKLDDGELVLVDKVAFEQQILKGFTYPTLKAPKKDQLINFEGLQQFYFQFLINQVDNIGTNALFWTGFKPQSIKATIPVYGAVDIYRQSLQNYPQLKVHQPLQVKNKSSVYLILKTKEGQLRVFISKNKDIAKPFNLFDVLTGNQSAVNLDLMGANVKSQSVQQVIDLGNLKPVITRPPKQAIAVLFDVSGSMGGQFFNEPDLKRIGAVKSFFEAFAFRTIAYNLEHVVSLFFFDHTVENQCGFTEAIYDFNRLIAKAAARGSTLMYDAVVKAADSLKKFKVTYPQCLLRIVALTDGQDTGSNHSVEQTTKILVDNQIVIDSFAVGANCQGLKTLSIASGGKCYLTRNLQQSLKLFEQETVLSVRARKADESIQKLSIEQRITKAKLMPFDLPNTVHEFKLPESQGGGISAKDMVKKMQNSNEAQKISGNSSLKRIGKQIQHYSDNPHPFVAIFPCSNINLWKILLLGPKETPYENGLFLLYAQFPGDYPFKAPEVRFITPIYHCNMNAQGRICHSVFDRNYSPAITFRQIVDCVYGLILTPQPEDPLDNVIASFYLSDYQTYLKNAKQFTKDKASLTTEKIVDELFGKIVDDSERKQRQKEIEEWIVLAKSFN